MKTFWRLKKVDRYNAAQQLVNRLPDLKNSLVLDVEDQLGETNLLFYELLETPTPWWIRLTMPFCIITMLLMIILQPIIYMITGEWGYSWLWLRTWIVATGLD